MRHEDQDPSADAIQHERVLIAAARERALECRSQVAAGWDPDATGPLRADSPGGSADYPLKPLRDQLPGYELEREIHRGGQGVVYLAVQRSTHRRVAIKVMKEGPFAGPDDKARFDREVRILGQLNHPSIVAIHDSGIAGGCYYFVMNYVAGAPLDVFIRDSEPTLQEALSLFVKIGEAVNAAHLRGIVHRDLKPSNIRIDADGEPHVLDFGLAKVEDGSQSPDETIIPAMTMTGQFVGSLPWASPEQAAGVAGGIDVRSDVYSLGVVLYQMLTGTFPYDVHGSMLEVVHRIVHAEPIKPSAAIERHDGSRAVFGTRHSGAPRWRINDEVETIVLKCLSKDRERRYQNAGELARDLRHYLAGEPIEARRDSLGYVLRKHVLRHRLGVAFACTLLVVLVAGLIISLTFWRQAESARIGLEGALERADQREKDLRQVANAQEKMLSSVGPQTMGARLRNDLLIEARAALERSGVDAEEVVASLGQLETLLSGTNFTNLGAQSIDRNVLAPALASIEQDYAGQPLVQAELLHTIATVYDRLGLLGAGVRAAEQAIAIRRRELGDKHVDTLESIYTLYSLLRKQGKLTEGEPYLQEVLVGYRDVLQKRRGELGGDDLETQSLLSRLARILWDVRKYAEAESYYRQALDWRRRSLGDDDPSTLGAMSGLGATLNALGRPSEAELYCREAMDRRRRVLGMSNQETLLSISNMGLLLTSMGRLSEAEPYQREALEGCLRLLGSDHEWTQMRTRNMATLMEHQGRLAEAEEYQREFVKQYRRANGDDHPNTLAAMAMLVKLLLDQGKYDEAEPLCRRTLETCHRVLGDNHQATLIVLSCKGRSLCGLGRLEDGEAIGADVVARARGTRLADRWLLSMFLTHHAQALLAMGRFDKAEAELIEAQQIVATEMGASHPRTSAAVRALADFYVAWHAAEPDKGHDIAAAELRAKLEGTSVPAPANPDSKP